MLRDIEDKLVDFSARQFNQFSLNDWLACSLDKDNLAVAAMFLSSQAWYGHRTELIKISTELNGEFNFPGLINKLHFDCGKFSGRLKARIKNDN